MPYYFIIYAKTDCGYCVEAIKLLNDNGFDYVLTLLDRAPDFHHALKLEHEWETVPLIFKVDAANKEMIGGYDDFKKWLGEISGDGGMCTI